MVFGLTVPFSKTPERLRLYRSSLSSGYRSLGIECSRDWKVAQDPS